MYNLHNLHNLYNLHPLYMPTRDRTFYISPMPFWSQWILSVTDLRISPNNQAVTMYYQGWCRQGIYIRITRTRGENAIVPRRRGGKNSIRSGNIEHRGRLACSALNVWAFEALKSRSTWFYTVHTESWVRLRRTSDVRLEMMFRLIQMRQLVKRHICLSGCLPQEPQTNAYR